MNRRTIYAAAIDDDPKDGDILTIVIIHDDSVEGASDKREGNLRELRNRIRNYMLATGQLAVGAAYATPNGKSMYHPFKVIAPDGAAYPEYREFKVRITYATTSIGTEHSAELRKGEKPTDFGTIYIRDDQKEFRAAETEAKMFIDSKIEEVHNWYVNSPETMSDI